MKLLVASLLFALSSPVFAANFAYPEMDDQMDAEQVFSVQSNDPRDCEDWEKIKSTEWTCFARDAHGGSLGVSTSFTRQDLAAGRALASCRRKSSIPNTCHITRCRQPEPQCP
jgi:hypothetical protein